MLDGRALHEIEDQLRALELEESHKDSLQSVTKALLEKAESQRKDIGKSYGAHNDLCRASKGLIKAWNHGQTEKITKYDGIIAKIWDILGTADLPADIAFQHDTESGQEISEAEIVKTLCPIAFGNKCEIPEIETKVRNLLETVWVKLGDPKADPALAGLVDTEDQLVDAERMKSGERKHKLSIPYQAWLSGASDSVGEISKLLENQLIAHLFCKGKTTGSDENTRLICQTVAAMKTLYEFLDSFETCYGQAINASRRKGFFNTFRGKLLNVEKEVRRWSDKLLDITIREACDVKFVNGSCKS